MQSLKLIVIVMGGLILVGLALLVYGVTQRLSEQEGGATEKVRNGEFGDIAVPLPAGCTIAEARTEDDRLILRADGPVGRGCQQVIVIDMASGEVLGRVQAAPQP